MKFSREGGVLLHPTSLPGPYGIGEIGPEAITFADSLADMGMHLWQVLPLGPTSYGDSPYQSPSIYAGNQLLISFDWLLESGLLTKSRLAQFPRIPEGHIDFGRVIIERMAVLQSVCRLFDRRASGEMKTAYELFCSKHAYWLDDYALFVALKNAHNGACWHKWPLELIRREPTALSSARSKYRTAIHHAKILQFLFNEHWHRLRNHAHRKGIKFIGDIPIFVAHDSADVWANPHLFYLDDHGRLTVQAGVPPDYFSKTGQLWGNPLYRWDELKKDNYHFWVSRFKRTLEMVDIIRLDHFRGFEAYWEVPADEETAIKGRWVKGPGIPFFESLLGQLGELPIIAEDLGVITKEVEAMRDHFKFPGMRILQFAFGNDPMAKSFLPDHYPENCAVYTGTHDNETTVGWFRSEAGVGSTRTAEEIEEERERVLEYLKSDGREINWDMIGLAMRSKANIAVVPLQDILGLDSSARMNLPGRPSGNWCWRATHGALTKDMIQRMRKIAEASKRV